MNVTLDVEARQSTPQWIAVAAPVLTIVAALVVGTVPLLWNGVNPIAVYETMFVGTLTTEYKLVQMFINAVPLILTGLAVYLPLRAGLWNIGAEGQLYLGAIFGTWVGVNVDASMPVLLSLMFLGGAVGGGLWGAIPGYLRAKWGVNEIIVTLMLTFMGLRLLNYLTHGPMQGGFFPGTESLPPQGQLPTLLGTPLHAGIFIALLAVLVVAALMRLTRFGYEVSFVGANPDAAVQAGMSTFWVYVLTLAIGGGLAGLAGIVEISGVQNQIPAQFEPGYGFTAIPIALLGRNGSFRVLLAGLFFALLFSGGTSVNTIYPVPAAIVDVIQALVILFLITGEFFKRFSVDVGIERSGTEAPAAGVEEGA